jgi:hypothetical protein
VDAEQQTHCPDPKTYNRQGKKKMKPLAVVDYNKHKAGVDLFDQRLSYGALEHKTVK